MQRRYLPIVTQPSVTLTPAHGKKIHTEASSIEAGTDTPSLIAEKPPTPIGASDEEPTTPIRAGDEEPSSPIPGLAQTAAGDSTPAEVTADDKDIVGIPTLERVYNLISHKLKPLEIGKPHIISMKSSDGLSETKLTVSKTADFEDSDGNMSDLHLVSVSPHTDDSSRSKLMLVKSIQVKKPVIKEKLDLIHVGRRFLTRQHKESKQPKGISHDETPGIADGILKQMRETLTNEHAIASQIYDDETILFDDGTKMLMPLFPGKKLFDENNVEYLKSLHYAKSLELAKKIVDGIEKIHKLNIGHFDVKPENILLDQKTESVKFIDFGTSHQFGSKTDILHEKRGTPAYMSPETLHATPPILGLKSDLYAIGKILECLLLEIPAEKTLGSPELQELIKQFIYRMQGKDKNGMLISYSETYMTEVYDKLRPDIDEVKLFFDKVNELVSLLESSATDKQSRINAIMTTLKTLVVPEQLKRTSTPTLSESRHGMFSIVDTTDIDIGSGQPGHSASFGL